MCYRLSSYIGLLVPVGHAADRLVIGCGRGASTKLKSIKCRKAVCDFLCMLQ